MPSTLYSCLNIGVMFHLSIHSDSTIIPIQARGVDGCVVLFVSSHPHPPPPFFLRYASLFFVAGIDVDDNELIALGKSRMDKEEIGGENLSLSVFV